MALAAGTKLGSYEIVALIGAGGMGEVYKGRDTRLGRAVAIKISTKPQDTARFQREARAASRLNHPNVCTIYDVGESGGRPFLVMELLDGRTLQECIRGRPLDFGTVINLATQIADALDEAHGKGVIHRDIKPANIFVTNRGQAKVVDFGLAKQYKLRDPASNTQSTEETITEPGSVMGTLPYMSPEQALGQPLDARTDLFSFGAVLYEMATGQPPFRGTAAAIVDGLLHRDPALASDLNPGLPAALLEIIAKALRKDRAERYQTASAIRSDLKALETLESKAEQAAISSPTLGEHKSEFVDSITTALFEKTAVASDAQELSDAGGALNPSLSAVMCDGMGWFSKNDFKRAILLYDNITYLVPSRTVEFRDVNGRPNFIVIPRELQQVGFRFQHFEPDDQIAKAIYESSKIDAKRAGFASIVARIPEFERTYTWRITNADADLGAGSSLGLHPDQGVLAHALLLNKFLIAADSFDAVPITGKRYIHALIGDKYREAQRLRSVGTPRVSNPSLNPIAFQVIQAIVPDDELERRSEIEIIHYKESNRRLFETFSYTIRKLVKQVSATPECPDFDRQVSELVNTEVWRDKTEVERELRGAWADFFKSAFTTAVAGAVTLGITPFLSLGRLSMAPVFAGVVAAPWAASALYNVVEKRKRAEQHGMYYLMNFSSA